MQASSDNGTASDGKYVAAASLRSRREGMVSFFSSTPRGPLFGGALGSYALLLHRAEREPAAHTVPIF